MKVIRVACLVLATALLFLSCQSLAQGAMSGAISAIAGGGAPSVGGGGALGSAPVVVEFQNGEVLVSRDSGSMFDAGFYVAKILTPASPSTKNQAEAVLIADGSRQWVNFVVNSRKATKADFVVGAPVFYLSGWQNHDEISVDTYRKDGWYLGNITSVDELYKNRVEIGGESYSINYVRVPTDPVK